MSVLACPRTVAAAIVTLVSLLGAGPAAAQNPSDSPAPTSQEPSQAPAGGAHAGHAMPGTTPDGHAGHEAQSSSREGSGTSWLPDASPVHAFHRQSGGWTVMGHGNVFLQYLHDTGARGSEQAGSINWLMGMAEHGVGAGRFTLRGMVSLEPWTIGGCGYPDLLATGELCNGDPIHDRQHPHDTFMEIAAEYDRPLAGAMRLQFYGGPAGEPALGPVAFMHRPSAMANPLAPITHHWFDSTHITYGVATAGIFGGRWKVEGSVFNGREPDERRTDFDFGAMDSWSGRGWFLPTKEWAVQVSAGHLNEAEAGHAGEPPTDVRRVTASISYHRLFGVGSLWANTIGWGRNSEAGADATSALLLESSLSINDRDVWYGRFEAAGKSSHDLVVSGGELFTVAKLQGGYARYSGEWKGLRPGIGVSVSAGIVPDQLRPAYGGRLNAGVGIYLTIRPAAHRM